MVCLVSAPVGFGKVTPTAEPPAPQKISDDLRKTIEEAQPGARINVIVQTQSSWPRLLDTLLQSLGGRILRRFTNFNSRLINLPVTAVAQIGARSDVRFVTPDRETRSFGHITGTTGADAVRLQTSTSLLGLTTTTTTLDGAGIGIAVLDSGIDPEHRSFLSGNGTSRIIVNQDFTGEGRTDDPYGHGTHVASAAAGNGQIAAGNYTGIAPKARIINLRVLKADGTGRMSDLLAALDWVQSNRSLYNIRVINMSLGTLAVESYVNDPLCRAVRRLSDAGVVVIAAAGNNGKDSQGNKIYGQIHSPGNEPSAITVG
ncbi:MAG TPA: S8 family serine peptidase, partial [Pyrinomonadaceae bacterium]